MLITGTLNLIDKMDGDVARSQKYGANGTTSGMVKFIFLIIAANDIKLSSCETCTGETG